MLADFLAHFLADFFGDVLSSASTCIVPGAHRAVQEPAAHDEQDRPR